jgi:hypothetical protein
MAIDYTDLLYWDLCIAKRLIQIVSSNLGNLAAFLPRLAVMTLVGAENCSEFTLAVASSTRLFAAIVTVIEADGQSQKGCSRLSAVGHRPLGLSPILSILFILSDF